MTVAQDDRQVRINVIREYWDTLMQRDMKRFEALLADDVLIHYPGQHYLSGDYRGKKDVVGLYARLTENVEQGGLHPGHDFHSRTLSHFGVLCQRHHLEREGDEESPLGGEEQVEQVGVKILDLDAGSLFRGGLQHA